MKNVISLSISLFYRKIRNKRILSRLIVYHITRNLTREAYLYAKNECEGGRTGARTPDLCNVNATL